MPSAQDKADGKPGLSLAVIDPDRIIVFDGICRLCCASFWFIHRRDTAGVFRYATAQSDAGRRILQWCGLPTDRYETMVYIAGGAVFQRSDAMLQIMRRLPSPWPCVSLARFCPRLIRDGIYNLIARHRYRIFGKHAACLVATDELSSRFL